MATGRCSSCPVRHCTTSTTSTLAVPHTRCCSVRAHTHRAQYGTALATHTHWSHCMLLARSAQETPGMSAAGSTADSSSPQHCTAANCSGEWVGTAQCTLPLVPCMCSTPPAPVQPAPHTHPRSHPDRTAHSALRTVSRSHPRVGCLCHSPSTTHTTHSRTSCYSQPRSPAASTPGSTPSFAQSSTDSSHPTHTRHSHSQQDMPTGCCPIARTCPCAPRSSSATGIHLHCCSSGGLYSAVSWHTFAAASTANSM